MSVVEMAALERHYTVAEVAQMWGWSETKVRDTFREARSSYPSIQMGQGQVMCRTPFLACGHVVSWRR